MRRIVLILAMLAVLLISAMPAMAQSWNEGNHWWDQGNDNSRWDDGNDGWDDDSQPSEPWCDWYEAGFDRNFGVEWWGYWCNWPGYGWYLSAWWSDENGYIRT
jgi:hypothetical protein